MARNNHNKILFPGALDVPQERPAIIQMTPFNDTQLVALIAAVTQEDTAQARVRLSIELIAEAVVQMEDNGLMKLIQEKKRQAQMPPEPKPA